MKRESRPSNIKKAKKKKVVNTGGREGDPLKKDSTFDIESRNGIHSFKFVPHFLNEKRKRGVDH